MKWAGISLAIVGLSQYDEVERAVSYTEPFVRCPAEFHIHFGGECLGLYQQCARPENHDKGHKSRDHRDDVIWDFDHRNTCTLSVVEPKEASKGEI